MPKPHLTRAGALALALAALGLLPARARATDEPFRMLSVPEVAALLGAPDARVYDANDRDQYAKAHLPGATFVSLKDLSARDLPAEKSTRLVFYCKNTR
jgi:rhodanese-related sulfurtransferase